MTTSPTTSAPLASAPWTRSTTSTSGTSSRAVPSSRTSCGSSARSARPSTTGRSPTPTTRRKACRSRQAFAACASGAISCEQGISDEKMDNPVLRLTWQVSDRNKIAAYADRALRLRGHAMGSLTDPRTASVIWNTPTFGTGSLKYTSTISSKLLLETGFSFNRERYDNLYQPGILAERGTDAVVPQRPQERHQHGPAVERLGRAAGQLPRSLQRPGRALVRHRHAQHQVRRRLPVGHLSPLQQRQRRPLPDLQQRRAVPGDGAEHPACACRRT